MKKCRWYSFISSHYNEVNAIFTNGMHGINKAYTRRYLQLLKFFRKRVVWSLGMPVSIKKVFSDKQILTLPSLYIYECIKYILSHEIPVSGFQHTCNTREKITCLPSHSSTEGHSHPYYVGTLLYNKLPHTMKVNNSNKAVLTNFSPCKRGTLYSSRWFFCCALSNFRGLSFLVLAFSFWLS